MTFSVVEHDVSDILHLSSTFVYQNSEFALLLINFNIWYLQLLGFMIPNIFQVMHVTSHLLILQILYSPVVRLRLG